MRVPAPRSRRFADSAADTLAKDKATPFVVIFEMVDTHKEGKISQAEFTAGWARAGFRSLTSRPI
jgi:hypothetical protein